MERTAGMTKADIAYVSGTRADFGLMRRALIALNESSDCRVSVAVTGMHLDEAYGATFREIEASGLPISARIPTQQGARDGLASCLAMADAITGLARAWSVQKPNAVMLLGDRSEMLAGALAAAHLDLPIVHIHGGERSGTLDEPVRHAISKLATLHWVATDESRERLIRMGEHAERISVVGAPGLDGIEADAQAGEAGLKALLQERFGSVPARFVLALMHPESASAVSAQEQTQMLAQTVEQMELPVLWLKPNADSGSAGVLAALEHMQRGHVQIVAHLERPVFCAAMASAALMVGNSSSGIIEAGSFGLPVINIGKRQNLRQRNANVRDVDWDVDALGVACNAALSEPKPLAANVFGDGASAPKMLAAWRAWRAQAVLGIEKVNAY
jgi:GDP/UDP-N,N'-diacetylbacillosamine 2-epimerase (hydrolysing)